LTDFAKAIFPFAKKLRLFYFAEKAWLPSTNRLNLRQFFSIARMILFFLA